MLFKPLPIAARKILRPFRAVSLIPRFGFLRNGLFQRMIVKVIARRFCKQKKMLIASRRSVFRAIRHGVRLAPDDVRPQIPTASAKSESEHPRNADEIFSLDVCIRFMCVCIADIQPQGTVVHEDAVYFVKDFDKVCDIRFGAAFSADLPVLLIVSEPVIGRACHAHLHASPGNALKNLCRIAAIKFTHPRPLSPHSAQPPTRSRAQTPAPQSVSRAVFPRASPRPFLR